MNTELKCEYCGFQYQGRASSLLMLHKCSDQELHYIDRIDLTENPLEELTEELAIPKEVNYYNNTPL